MSKIQKSLSDMVWDFAKEVTEHAMGGFEHVDPTTYRKRMSICLECPSLIKDIGRCSLCGCFMETKAKWKTSMCPENPPKWLNENQNG